MSDSASNSENIDPAEIEPRYQVVVNLEEQFSLWPEGRELPAGWRAEGTVGTEQECLDRIEAVWTDMRPLSARK